MFEAQYLIPESDEQLHVYSPWMPRNGDNITITLDMLDLIAPARLLVTLYHKNSEETGPGTAATGTPIVASVATTFATTYTDVKEMVRFKFTCASGPGTSGDYVLFRMLAPVWSDEVGA